MTQWDITVPSQRSRLAGVRMAGFSERSAGLVDLRLVPYPAVTLFINLGDRVLIDHTDGQWRDSVAVGLAPGIVRARGWQVECLQVRLPPLVAHAMFGGVAELSETAAAFEDVWGRDAERTRERLRAARSWDERFAVAEAALIRRCLAGRTADPEVAFAWRRMLAGQGQVRVDQLAAEAGWSRKRLWSRFRSQVGLTPKHAAQLIRFDHAAHLLAAGESAALVAADSGYSDQSHLHRDVRTFAGVTPSAVAAAPWLAVDDIAWR